MNKDLVIAAVGDIVVMRDKPRSMFEHVKDELQAADITFGQLETAYSAKGSRGSSGPRGVLPKDPANREALAWAGFDVISMASNHTSDWGADALLDCIHHLRKDGIKPIGAGATITEAREPAIFEMDGHKIAFLAYCSVAPDGYYAASNKPGSVPMRAITHYEPFEPDQPGTPARIMTFPVEKDLAALIDDVHKAKQQADLVAMSIHWGIHGLRGALADYQQVVAHEAIDAGVDIILGHHPHMLKGIEVYHGKPIFYSLGNFAIEPRTPRFFETVNQDWIQESAEFYGKPDAPTSAWKLLDEMTVIARWAVSRDGEQRASFIPCVFGNGNEPMPVDPGSPEGAKIVDFVTSITAEAGLNAKFTVSGREVFVDCSINGRKINSPENAGQPTSQPLQRKV